MPYNKQNIDFKKLVIWLLPTPTRRPALIAWIMGLIAPAIRLYNQFISFWQYSIYRLSITPQVCYLEKALNDKYDTQLRRIIIVDALEFEGVPFYRKPESKPVVIYKKTEGTALVLYTKSESSIFGVDFIIEIPNDVVFNSTELTAFVNSYKLATKLFKIRIV
jgi:hypothetical protein